MKNKAVEPAGTADDNSQDQPRNTSTSGARPALPENEHARSHAAHLDTGSDQPHTKPAVQPTLNPGARKQPNGGHGR